MSREEFEKIAEKYMDTIYRVAYSWMKNQHDANDVTQIVLLKLYKTTKSFESDDYIKMNFRSPWSKTEDITDYAQTLGFEEEQNYDLFQAVMKLDKKYSVLLMLFYYDGYSTKEISAMIGVPEKTVSTRLFRAKAKLKNYLKED